MINNPKRQIGITPHLGIKPACLTHQNRDYAPPRFLRRLARLLLDIWHEQRINNGERKQDEKRKAEAERQPDENQKDRRAIGDDE
jgi:hypothetical protein